MGLSGRLHAGLRLIGAQWARDLVHLYNVGPGEALVLTVRRPASGNELVVEVRAPRTESARGGRPA